MKKGLSILFTLSIILFLTQCNSDDNDSQEPTNTISEGVFLDSPVQGLSYTSFSVSGKTNSDGTFKYETDKTITFNIGGISIGETLGKNEITPLDLINEDINNQQVRNIASFLQSLDSDNNPSNGIVINEDTNQALSNETLDFNSDSFFIELTKLINRINTTNSSSLVVVNSNDAAFHLAESLNLQVEYKFLPQTIQGREWEIGTYYQYSTSSSNEYWIKIENENLTNVKYHFGDGRGYLLDMQYEQNRLNGFGNFYFTGLNSNNPTDTTYLYDNRTASTGFVFDYGSDTFIGYYNLYKTEGEEGSLQGTYKSLLFNTKEYINSPGEIIIHYLNDNEVTIGDPNANGDFPVNIVGYDADHNIVENYNSIITSESINNQNVLLVQFQETDHLFINKDIQTQENYIGIGVYGLKE